MAESSDSPFPWETATDRELGRETMITGRPIRSRPVTLATRVIPICAKCGRTRAIVSAGGMLRCVSVV